MDVEISSIKEVTDLIVPFTINLPNSEILKIFKPEYEKQIIRAKELHLISLHHVAKIENKYHKIPATPTLRKVLEPEGIFLYRLFELCVGLHPRINNPYKNAYYWFLDINKELLNGKILLILNPYEFTKKPKNGDKKRVLTSIFNSELTDIQNSKNPYKNISYLPLSSNLINLAIKKSEYSLEFKKSYLDPFILAGRNLIKAQCSPDWSVVTVDEKGRIYAQGQGRSKKFF